ncbi:NACHT, LRR and PYD domains-containing protein 12-like isoform X2 [Hemibagrus wyckioides]|nr:NACHT, LRR and PYD domains-containing protein 12-like isoform X2 [Hemibagrus wyckioides]
MSMKSDESMILPPTFKEKRESSPGYSETHKKRSDSLVPSCVSMKSDESMILPPTFKEKRESSPGYSETQIKRSDSPSCVSMKSDESMILPPTFKDTRESSPRYGQHICMELRYTNSSKLSAGPSSASMSSDVCTEPPPGLTNEDFSFSHHVCVCVCVCVCSETHKKRSDSLVPSCVSMKSDESMILPPTFKEKRESSPGYSETHKKRSDSLVPSCVSMKSDESMILPPTFKEKRESSPGYRETQIKRSDSPSCVSMKSDESMILPPTFKDKRESSPRHGQHICMELKYTNSSDLQRGRDKIEQKIIITDKGCKSVNTGPHLQERCRLNLIKKFQHVNEMITNQRSPTLLNEIYTELYITEGDSGKVNNEHEVRQIEAASRRAATEETPIKCNDIFKTLPEEDKPIRSVLTKGVAGIGKTVSVQKFILDWAEGKTNQDVHLIFPLPFRELNLIKDQTISLMELLHFFFKEMKETNISTLHKVLFIFDGLDECRFPLDFQNTVRVCDGTESASVNVLLINLIKGNLLPSALIWITSRPAAADQIPSEWINRVTEVRGFNDPQKEEYFRKRIRDQSLSNRIITHLKSLRSLYIMCHIPVFCWISATVLERMLGEAESGEIPKTLTQMYTHFLIIQTNIIKKKYTESREADKEMVLKLGKLAFRQLMKGNLIFYEEDLRECGIGVTEASVYSGVCTQIFREEFGLHQSKVYCFVHLSIQEHLAALYVHLTFMNEKKNVLQKKLFPIMFTMPREITVLDVHKSAVDQALQSENGHLDLFLRFLLGLSLESNQILLQIIVTQTETSSNCRQDTVNYIRKMIRENLSTEKSINLFHCLNELEDHSLVEEIQHYLQLRYSKKTKLSPSQWSALVFMLLTSAQEQDVFVLKKYTNKHYTSDKVLLKLLPVVAASRKADFNNCNLKDKGCTALASVLSSESSSLRELDLSENKLRDSGVKSLSAGLENPHCKLETLRFSLEVTFAKTAFCKKSIKLLQKILISSRTSSVHYSTPGFPDCLGLHLLLQLCSCRFPDKGCAAVISALKSNPSHLRELDLSENNLRDSEVKCLSAVLEHPHCNLETLRLCYCGVLDEGCAALTSALRSNPSHLRHLDLSRNKLRDSGVKSLSAVLENPHCKLETLRVKLCDVTDEGCDALTSALRSNPSQMRKLDLSKNKLRDSGVKSLSAVLENPHCKLETLRLKLCDMTNKGCAALTSALRSNPSHLRDLDLSRNKLRDLGVKSLSAVLENPHCNLETLRLCDCEISDEGCDALTSALRSNPSHLRELDLSENKLRDSGVKSLSAVLENPHCKLETLRLRYCKISDEGCDALTSALRSNPSHLRELDLSWNKLRDSGVKSLSAVLENPHCNLETLRLSGCEISDEGCAALTSALRSNPSHLRELDLSVNKLRDSGVKCLSAVLKNPHCKLETLRLSGCEISDEGCAALTSALRSNPSHLRHLDLSRNKLRDSGVKSLSAVLENPHCKLETLRLSGCEISDEGCAALTSALRSNPSHLRELDLSGNKLRDSGVKNLSAVLENPHCKLETLR